MSKTPKKIYAVSSTPNSCRLCQSVGDSANCKNLCGKANRTLLLAAEEITAVSFRGVDYILLPHLLSRPCERRLKNFIAFKALISEIQGSLKGVKRCIEESSSVLRSLKTPKGTDNSVARVD